GGDRDYNNRIGADKFNIIHANDTVRSLEVDPKGPSKGDFRIVCALKDVPATYFAGFAGTNAAGAGGYADPAARLVHSIRNGNDGTANGGQIKGNLVASGSPLNPMVARGTTAAMMDATMLGDWDNGPYNFPDGAYINKPDDYYGSQDGGDRWE